MVLHRLSMLIDCGSDCDPSHVSRNTTTGVPHLLQTRHWSQ